MNSYTFTTKGHTSALEYAAKELVLAGWQQVPDAPVILLPVPSLDANGHIKGGGTLETIPAGAMVIGGNLHHAACKQHRCVDFLRDERYLAENAAITAHCALCIAMENLPVTLSDCNVLVLGWGRIGKCLVRLLRLMGASVTVGARKESDRAVAEALGYQVLDTENNSPDLSGYRVIFNTVPAMVLPAWKLSTCPSNCLKIDLASEPGIEGADVIWARGLPNMDAPESSGKLIARIVRKELEK